MKMKWIPFKDYLRTRAEGVDTYSPCNKLSDFKEAQKWLSFNSILYKELKKEINKREEELLQQLPSLKGLKFKFEFLSNDGSLLGEVKNPKNIRYYFHPNGLKIAHDEYGKTCIEELRSLYVYDA